MLKSIMLAAVAASTIAGAASAATLTGTFNVRAVNVQGINSSASQATTSNFIAARLASNPEDLFTYTGALNFGTFDGTDATTIGDWLATGSGVVDGLDPTIAGLQLSKPNINNGTATTTFFNFIMTDLLGPVTRFVVNHDDGVALFDDGVRIGGFNGPNSQRTTTVTGFDGGSFALLYVATNGDPSVLRISAVPLPASLPLLLAGLGGLAFLRRRARA